MKKQRKRELQAEYERHCHAMQTGVDAMMHHDPSETDTKHLRVGVNSAMVSHGALVDLLVEKGLITGEEYFEKLVSKMAEEAAAYKEKVCRSIGWKWPGITDEHLVGDLPRGELPAERDWNG